MVKAAMPNFKKRDFKKTTAAAIRTAKWAITMTTWRIGFETGGKRLSKPGTKPGRPAPEA